MNDLNQRMKATIESYCNKNNLTIQNEQYGKYYYQVFLDNNEEIICNTMENITSNKKLPVFYMKRITNGKQKRIPKNEW